MTATTAEPASADAVASAGTAEATAAAPNTPDAAAQAREGAILRLEQELGGVIGRIRASWRDAAAEVHPDLQPLGYQVLVAIAGGKATAIVERLQTDKSAVSRQVRHLEDLGLVESRPDADDRRARVLAATHVARERLAAARRRYQHRMSDRLSQWSVDDLGRASDVLRDLAR
ncbi:MarR family winged helix-turn-helix transcriptional regulator [Microbacterium lacticum]